MYENISLISWPDWHVARFFGVQQMYNPFYNGSPLFK